MKYPGGIKKKTIKHVITYENRGMTLEADINQSNEYYKEQKRAFIYKKPTPIKLVKVDYHRNLIQEGYFEKPSTTDYNGIYRGKYIDFEAKETTSKTSFPLKNIHPHQIEHIKNVIKQGGIAFLIVKFSILDKIFYLRGEDFIDFLRSNQRKSLPLSFFEEKGFIIKQTYRPSLDYLKVVDQIMEVDNNGKKSCEKANNEK